VGIQAPDDEFLCRTRRCRNAVGRSRSATSNLLRLLKLPQVIQDMVMVASLTWATRVHYWHWKACSKSLLQNKIVSDGLSVREAEKLFSTF